MACIRLRAPHPVVPQVGLHSCPVEGSMDGLPGEEGVVEAPGETDRRGVSDLLLHADDVVDMTKNHLGLLLGVAGVEHDATEVWREQPEKSARTSVETGAAPCSSSRASPVPPVHARRNGEPGAGGPEVRSEGQGAWRPGVVEPRSDPGTSPSEGSRVSPETLGQGASGPDPWAPLPGGGY